ncbi:MAG: MMPL family transporter [Aeromicrobium sp.]|uniref:MMPL family transporter n=1 Tax=Aeromicrobium sp. TaxID=1871063 RepID=UPI0039E3B401
MSTFLYQLGRWAFRHSTRVILAWIALILVAGGAAATLGDGTRNEFTIPGSQAQEAFDSLERTFPEISGVSAYLVIVAPDGTTIHDAAARGLIEQTVARIDAVDGVREASSPFGMLEDIAISGDDSAAQVQVQLAGGYEDVTAGLKDDLLATADPLADAGYTVAFGGDAFASSGPKLSIVEVVGVVVAFTVLYWMFRSASAAVMSIGTALVGVAVALELTWIATGFLTISSTSPLLALMIGLAVGIDYALFIVSRYRELLAEGVAAEEAAARAVATAGSAVVFAGATVMIALLGLAVARIPFLTVMGVIGSLAVAVSVVVAVTLLPAALALAGERLRPADGERPPGSFSRRWVALTTRFPALSIVLIVVGLAIAAIPAKDLQLALPDNGTEPPDSAARVSYDLVEREFGPGYNGPLLVTMNIIGTTDPLGVVDALERDLSTIPGVQAIGLATPNATADTAVIQVLPETGPRDARTAELVHTIRDAAPQWEDEYGIDVAVTGYTAAGIDVSERLRSALLPFGIVVMGLSLLLLMIVFRSVLVPLKATLGFLLSTGASFGAVVAVFQWGWLGGLVHLDQPGPLISFLPILLMAVLFGLSMDYEVFLMARMKEEYGRTRDADRAIVDGFVGSSRVVTAAAVIMLAVFAAFVPDGDANIRPIAFALAVGVFADAFLVRMFFAPAVMKFAGHRAWSMPGFLARRLPHVDAEGEALYERIALESWPPGHTGDALTAAGLTLQTSEGLVYNDVAASLPRGDWLIVHGPDGSGKTALLLTLAGRMAFTAGRLRVAGHLLPHESGAVRKAAALGEIRGVNDLDDNLTVDQHIAERLSIRTFGLWVSRAKVAPVRHRLNLALEAAHTEAGIPFAEIEGTRLVSSLSRLERTCLGVVLALVSDPELLVLDDADRLRSPADLALLWATLRHLLAGGSTALVASVKSPETAPPPGPHIHLVEINTRRTLDELML